MKNILVGLALLASMLAAPATIAQQFPSKPLRIVVPAGPGAPPDIVARAMAEPMGRILGQPVIVENRPGANMMIGYEYAAKQPADGYTLALGFPTSLATLPSLYRELRFDVLKDLPPLIAIADVSTVFVASRKRPWKSLNEFAADARANPGKYNYATSGTAIQLLTEALLQSLGVKATPIPFGMGTTYQTALGSGDVDVAVLGELTAVSMKDRVHVLVASGSTRASSFPDVPTVKELGLVDKMGLDMMTQMTLNAPKGTPKPVLDLLYRAAQQAMEDPKVKARLEGMGARAPGRPNTPQSNQQRLEAEAALLNPLAKRLGIEPMN